MLQVLPEGEAAAKRRGEHRGIGRGADDRHPRGLHGDIERLGGTQRQAVDLVDEENSTRRDLGDLPGKLMGLGDERREHGPALPAEFRGDRPGKARFSQSRRPAEQNVAQRLIAADRGPDSTAEIPDHHLLADEVVHPRR